MERPRRRERDLLGRGDKGVAGEVRGEHEVALLGGEGFPEDDGVGAGDPCRRAAEVIGGRDDPPPPRRQRPLASPPFQPWTRASGGERRGGASTAQESVTGASLLMSPRMRRELYMCGRRANNPSVNGKLASPPRQSSLLSRTPGRSNGQNCGIRRHKRMQ